MRQVLTVALLALLLPAAVAFGQDPQAAPSESTNVVPVIGYISWPGHDLTNGTVRMYSDPQCRQLVSAESSEGATGNFVLSAPPGKYYLMAVVDVNGNGKMDAGDGIGSYGMTDAAAQKQPVPLMLDQGSQAASISIAITLQMGAGEDGRPRLTAIPAQPAPPMPVNGSAHISGHCTSAVDKLPIWVLGWAPFPRAPSAAAMCDASGDFSMNALPEGYNLLAVQDRNANGRIDKGDLVGFWNPTGQTGPDLPAVRLTLGQELADVTMDLKWVVGEDGQLLDTAGNAAGPRLQLGSLPVIASGVVMDGDKPAPGATVTVFGDQGLQQKIAQVRADANGRYCAAVSAAAYVVGATYDADGDGRLGPGDRIGFYGLGAEQTGPPSPLAMQPGQLLIKLEIQLTITVPQGQPEPGPPQGAGEDTTTDGTQK